MRSPSVRSAAEIASSIVDARIVGNRRIVPTAATDSLTTMTLPRRGASHHRVSMRPTLLLATALALVLAGCGGTRFMDKAERQSAPPAGKALVNFHRPSNWGGGQDYPIFDRKALIGNLKGGSQFQYACDPGDHLFIGRADHVTAVKANVEAGKVYDILVDTSPGAWQLNIFLSPVAKDDARRSQLASFEKREKPLALADHEDARKYEEKQSKDLDQIIRDFDGGGKADRLKTLSPQDAR
jgi:hypothetical protein